MRPIIALLLLLSPAAYAQDNDETASEQVKHGQLLFMSSGCYECHGTVGQGGSAGPRLAPDPLPAAAIQAYIRKPAGVMPPYADATNLPDRAIQDIHAYLASIPKQPALKDIPLLARSN